MDRLSASFNGPDQKLGPDNSTVLSKILNLLRRTIWLLVGIVIGLMMDDPALPFTFKSKKKVSKQNLDVLIVGAGISGIAIAKVGSKQQLRNSSKWKTI